MKLLSRRTVFVGLVGPLPQNPHRPQGPNRILRRPPASKPQSRPQTPAIPHSAPPSHQFRSPQTQTPDSPYIPATPTAHPSPAEIPATPHVPPPLVVVVLPADHSQSQG